MTQHVATWKRVRRVTDGHIALVFLITDFADFSAAIFTGVNCVDRFKAVKAVARLDRMKDVIVTGVHGEAVRHRAHTAVRPSMHAPHPATIALGSEEKRSINHNVSYIRSSHTFDIQQR